MKPCVWPVYLRNVKRKRKERNGVKKKTKHYLSLKKYWFVMFVRRRRRRSIGLRAFIYSVTIPTTSTGIITLKEVPGK